MRPPIRSTSVLEIARPSPVPPYRRVVDPSACVNASKTAALTIGRDADARVGDREVQHASDLGVRSARDAHSDAPVLGELDRVADEIRQHLPQPRPVADDAVGHAARDVAGEPSPFSCARSASGFSAFGQLIAQLKRRRIQPSSSRLDLREVEDVVDDAEQRLSPTPAPSSGTRAARASAPCRASGRSCR